MTAPGKPTAVKKVVIIGGGITGLAAAYYLEQQAQLNGRSIEYILLEKETRLGGKISTDREGPFLVDGGPDCFITYKPWGVDLCRDLGLGNNLIGTQPVKRKTSILDSGRLKPLPDGVMLIVPTRLMPFALSPLFSIFGKLRMAMEILIPPRSEAGDETLASFIRRRLGNEALDKLAEPLLSGIYTNDPEKMSLQSSFPRFIALEKKFGSLTRGMLSTKRSRRRNSPPGSNHQLPMFVTLEEGLEQLTDTLQHHIPERSLRLSTRAVNIQKDTRKGTPYLIHTEDGEQLAADGIILTTPANISSHIIKNIHPLLSKKLSRIRFSSSAVMSLGFSQQNQLPELDGYGFLVPKTAGRRINACTWSSKKFNYRAPDNHLLLRCFLGGPGNENLVNLPPDEILAIVLDELKDIIGLEAQPQMVKLYRWINGHPQYDLGHPDLVKELHLLTRDQTGIYLAGSSYDGIGIPDCVRQAKEAVIKLMGDFESTENT